MLEVLCSAGGNEGWEREDESTIESKERNDELKSECKMAFVSDTKHGACSLWHLLQGGLLQGFQGPSSDPWIRTA